MWRLCSSQKSLMDKGSPSCPGDLWSLSRPQGVRHWLDLEVWQLNICEWYRCRQCVTTATQTLCPQASNIMNWAVQAHIWHRGCCNLAVNELTFLSAFVCCPPCKLREKRTTQASFSLQKTQTLYNTKRTIVWEPHIYHQNKSDSTEVHAFLFHTAFQVNYAIIQNISNLFTDDVKI